MSDLKVSINDACSGCGVCEGTAPEVFQMNDSGVAEVQAEGLAAADDDIVIEAAEGCPCEAIIVERDGEQIVPA
jgi:ferredoxin